MTYSYQIFRTARFQSCRLRDSSPFILQTEKSVECDELPKGGADLEVGVNGT